MPRRLAGRGGRPEALPPPADDRRGALPRRQRHQVASDIFGLNTLAEGVCLLRPLAGCGPDHRAVRPATRGSSIAPMDVTGSRVRRSSTRSRRRRTPLPPLSCGASTRTRRPTAASGTCSPIRSGCCWPCCLPHHGHHPGTTPWSPAGRSTIVHDLFTGLARQKRKRLLRQPGSRPADLRLGAFLVGLGHLHSRVACLLVRGCRCAGVTPEELAGVREDLVAFAAELFDGFFRADQRRWGQA